MQVKFETRQNRRNVRIRTALPNKTIQRAHVNSLCLRKAGPVTSILSLLAPRSPSVG